MFLKNKRMSSVNMYHVIGPLLINGNQYVLFEYKHSVPINAAVENQLDKDTNTLLDEIKLLFQKIYKLNAFGNTAIYVN